MIGSNRTRKLFNSVLAAITAASVAIPSASFAAGRELKIIDSHVSLDPVKNVNRDTQLTFYINGGENDGLYESMLLDVFKAIEMKEKKSGKKYESRVHVGQLKTIKVSKDISTAKLNSPPPAPAGRGVMVGDYVVAVPEPQPSGEKNAAGSQPALPVKAKPQPQAISEPKTILFKSHNWQITDDIKDQLSKIHDQFSKIDNGEISVEGHTDNAGNEEYNLKLSELRAQAVANYFIKTKGVPAAKVHFKGFGGEKPSDSNDTEQGREKNRRAVVQLIKN